MAASTASHDAAMHGDEPLDRDRVGYAVLAAGMINHALAQMATPLTRKHKPERWAARRDATVWLGSRWATPYFDFVGWSQSRILARSDWSRYARKLLGVKPRAKGYLHRCALLPLERRMLEDGIAYMTRLADRQRRVHRRDRNRAALLARERRARERRARERRQRARRRADGASRSPLAAR